MQVCGIHRHITLSGVAIKQDMYTHKPGVRELLNYDIILHCYSQRDHKIIVFMQTHFK